MVNDEEYRKLKSLADQHGIKQRSRIDSWPVAHQSIFQSVQDLSRITFETYSNAIKDGLDDKPGRQANGSRAEWLVKQASQLCRSAANESTWRMRIENPILERFFLEVACPRCKNRLWRSEIETTPTEPSRISAELQRRRDQRECCKCPPADRPQGLYEQCTSGLFEDKIQEAVIHSNSTEKLPRKSPDRIVGLAETNKIRTFLDKPPQSNHDTDAHSIRDLVQCSSHKLQSNPPLFPFLAIEAKSDSAPVSFSDLQTQTAFPIWAFLKLQKDLQAFKASDKGRPEPLVWFLGYKGSDWKFYGCYISNESTSKFTYNIHYLRGDDISTKDGALQLLLIIDFVMDWARDIFRPSIMAQLDSLATGTDFDQVSLGPDSEIWSKNKTILAWNSQVPSTVLQDDEPNMPKTRRRDTRLQEDEQEIVIPNTRFGTIKSMSETIFELVGLRINDSNVDSLLTSSDWRDLVCGQRKYSACARKLVNELGRWDEVFVVLGADLDYIERAWASEEKTSEPQPFAEGEGTEFYAVFEYRCYMNDKSELVRELSYWAVSRSAYNILMKKADYRQKQFREAATLDNVRPCPSALLHDAVDCLRSGSAWQVFRAAMSGTLITLYPIPEAIRDDYTPPVSALSFGYLSTLRVRHLIEDYCKLAKLEQPKQMRRFQLLSECANGEPRTKRLTSEIDVWARKTSDRSFCRFFQRHVRDLGTSHISTECSRCIESKQNFFELKSWDQKNFPPLTAYNAVLVASLNEEPAVPKAEEQNKCYDIFLFYNGSQEWLTDKISIATVVEDLAQNGSIYHTIRHGSAKNISEPRAQLWNLPYPYRKKTRRQSQDIDRWVNELSRDPLAFRRTKVDGPFVNGEQKSTSLWTEQQILLHYLQSNKSHNEALVALKDFMDAKRKEYNDTSLWHESVFPRPRFINPDFVRLSSFLDIVRPEKRDWEAVKSLVPTRINLRGDV